MSGPALTAAFGIQAAVRAQLTDWSGLEGVDVATGPRRKDVVEGVTVARPRAVSRYMGAYRAEEGSVAIVCDAFVAGTGEDAIDAARERASEIVTECVAALSLHEQTGGDITVGDLVLAIGTEITLEEADNYLEADGARVAGHGYTISATVNYTARLVTGGSTP